MAWHEAWGTYARSGAPYDVGMAGSPSGSSLGLNLAKAKQEGHGRGVEFTSLNNEGTSVKLTLSLIGMSLAKGKYEPKGIGYASPNGSYTASGWTYEWFVDLYISKDNGKSYQPLSGNTNIKVASHPTPMNLAYHESGGSVASWKKAFIEWSKTLTLPKDFTHLKFEVRGEDPAQRHQNVFERKVILPDLTTKWVDSNGKDLAPPEVDKSYKPAKTFPNYNLSGESISGNTKTYIYGLAEFRPWATRKSGRFKSHETNNGWFKIRKSNNWSDVSTMSPADSQQTDKGNHRIRKSGTWKGQSKIGE